MDLNGVLKQKKEKNTLLKSKFGLPIAKKAIGLVKISNKSLIKDLRDALIILPASFIIEVEGVENEKLGHNIIATSNIDKNDIIGFDFLLTTDDIKLNDYFSQGITPILPKDNSFKSLIKEFNPLKNEGNAYIFDQIEKWSIFYALVRYLENYKFVFDNKNLVKNILNI